ncbi:alpha/beta hydrolase [Amycolatopsis sp. NBC_00345]|uniref:alpha/beta hydrolase n=1 Tax=Amycolatopsis sp. NBC_00345 TaxID=2975955 RepID=UPI002E255F47
MTTETDAADDAGSLKQFEVHHDGVTIAVSRGGRGRPLVLCPGLLSTQAALRELISLLRRDYDVVTFDLRGHGLSSAAGDYTFDAFLSDLTAVLAELTRRGLSSPPLLMGYSLGADLAVHYAAAHPGALAGLVLVDGANPVPEPFVTEADLAEFTGMAEAFAEQAETAVGTPHQVLLAPPDIVGLNVAIDGVRSEILGRYREIGGPVRMIMSTAMAGTGGEGRGPWRNRNWRAGINRLLGERPDIAVSWLEADHRLVMTHAAEIARIVRAAS